MQSHRYVLSALLAAVVLAAAVGAASASRLSTSSQSTKIVWSGLTFTGGGQAITCPVTLEGTLHESSIAKIRRSLIGFITRARASRPCTNGTAWVYNGSESNEVLGGTLSNSLPWHITYEGFTGPLPNITEIHLLLIRARFLVRATLLGIPALCNYTTTLEHPAEGWLRFGRGGVVSSLRPNERVNIPSETGGVCPEGAFSVEGTVTNGSGGNVTITLI